MQTEMPDETPIWSYIPLADFDAPRPPSSDAGPRLGRMWKSLQGLRPKKKTLGEAPEWDRPAIDVLRSLAPEPDWEQAATLLPGALGDDWFDERQPARPRYALVGPPGCDVAEVLQALARQRRLKVLSPPSPEELLEAPKSNRAASHAVDESSGEILVIPHLERWYLRHEDGLTLVRNLVERLLVSRKRVLLGCDSWAWAFLRYAIGIEDMLGEPHTVAPFDGKRLDAWFRSTLDFEGFEFRQRGDEEPVFPELPPANQTKTTETPCEGSRLIRSLAARARGNPGVALALWRTSLRTCDEKGQASAPPAKTSQSILWAISPGELASPLLHADLDRVHLFVLHSVLLHGGLPLSTLIALLPFSSDEIQRRVRLMHRAGILEEQGGRLRMTLMAYPFVRRALLSDGFLTDAF